MKTTIRLMALGLGLGLLVPGVLSSGQAAPAKGAAKAKTTAPKWSTDYKAALAQAKRLKKPIFIDFSTDWCVGCKVLEEKTFPDSRFIAASRKWVLVRINPEKSAANAQLEKNFRVTGYPTLVMADSDGKFINQVVGSYPAEMLVPKMDAAIKQLQAERRTASR